eukprot:2817869-Rhodomonas_salina.1
MPDSDIAYVVTREDSKMQEAFSSSMRKLSIDKVDSAICRRVRLAIMRGADTAFGEAGKAGAAAGGAALGVEELSN